MRDVKGKEYAHSEECFANFNRAAERLKLDRLKVAMVYRDKHIDSIASFIADRKTYSGEHIRGRYIDAINYLTFELGMIEEEQALPADVKTSPDSKFIAAQDGASCGVIDKPTNYICTISKGHKHEHEARGIGGQLRHSWPLDEVRAEPAVPETLKTEDFKINEIVKYKGLNTKYLNSGNNYRLVHFDKIRSMPSAGLSIGPNTIAYTALWNIQKLAGETKPLTGTVSCP